MTANYIYFKDKIRMCLDKLDVNYFIRDLKDIFSDRSFRLINDSNDIYKVETFLDEFDKVNGCDKFNRFKMSAEKHNTWIYKFLTVDLHNQDDIFNLDGLWIVLNNLLDMLYNAEESLWVIDDTFINILCSKDIITYANKCCLLQRLEEYGEIATMFELFNVITARTPDWYGVVLWSILRQQTAFSVVICNELRLQENINESEKEQKIMEFSHHFIEKHIARYRVENQPMEDSNSDGGFDDYMSYDEAESTAASDVECFDNDLDITSWFNDEQMKPTRLIMKDFQLELAELAVNGKNVIIYAPTGIGKTIVAIYIANEHLRNNPNGKVAFLVPRRHLVSQQFTAFEKYKDPELSVIEMRGRSETKIGPLISHLENNQIFVMTGGIFYNSLTVKDGNKISSINEFSLIFFDECHNCMKQNTYNKIMCQYINEKELYPNRKPPQIVGLTASPRSNNSDDKRTMRNSVFELCANLDCQNFAFVKRCVTNLKEEIIKPVQKVIRVPRRESNEFEASLMYLMEQCEKKLEKMKKELYFPRYEIKCIPTDRFSLAYCSFVGNLQSLNNSTIEENDGKQKVYSIYRYLNAYYRGLIVHQLFDEFYAKECIDRYMDHDGETFTCCYDEEFNGSYKARIFVGHQSDNPSIEKIKDLIESQFEYNENSRILIFVPQVAYTYYLVDLIRKTSNIEAEAIVGSNSKNNLKGCSKTETTELLTRFRKGDFKVLVATSVVEEGLDVPDCNMVISYGYVTDEIALIQRLGRARAVNSKYFLVLPPMLAWMENKENNNRRRNETMMTLIQEYEQMDFNSTEIADCIKIYQQKLFNLCKKVVPTNVSNRESWKFKCKSCQAVICTSEELRVLEISHIVCSNPDVIKKLKFIPKETKVYGLHGNYELMGSLACTCNHRLGKKVLYQRHPYLQIRIDRCTVTKDARPVNFRKWKDFTIKYTVPDITMDEIQDYISHISDIDL